jgi:hypothetical protein
MSGMILSTVGFTSQTQAEVSTATLRASGPCGTTTRSTLDTQVSVQTDLQTTVTTLDPEAAAAIIGSVDASTAGQGPDRRRLMLGGALSDLDKAMSQGQGAIFFNFRAPGGGGAVGAVTPSEVSAILAGHGSNLGSINGYALSDVLRAAFSQKVKVERSGSIDAQAADDPKVTNARLALALLEGKGRASGSKSVAAAKPGDDAAQQIYTLVGAMVTDTPGSENPNAATLTLIYVPPTETDTFEIKTTQSISTETSALLDVHA